MSIIGEAIARTSREHYTRTIPSAYEPGWYAACGCGWESRVFADKFRAESSARGHLNKNKATA